MISSFRYICPKAKLEDYFSKFHLGTVWLIHKVHHAYYALQSSGLEIGHFKKTKTQETEKSRKETQNLAKKP